MDSANTRNLDMSRGLMAAQTGRGIARTLAIIVLVFTRWAGADAGAGVEGGAFLAAYEERLRTVRKNIPQITRLAEKAAQAWVKHERLYIGVEYDKNVNSHDFSLELWSRAGGLENVTSGLMRGIAGQLTGHDFVLYGICSWETTSEWLAGKNEVYKTLGWTPVAFASKQGMPKELVSLGVTCIDNGAPNGSDEYGALNGLVNVTNGWIWCCELVAALTREGKHPAVLRSAVLPGATKHNDSVNHPDFESTLYPCDVSIPAGKLAEEFMTAVEKAVESLKGDITQAQLGKAADIAVERIQKGRTVWVTSFTHYLLANVERYNRAPVKSYYCLYADEEFFREKMKPGDLVFLWGEWTMQLQRTDEAGKKWQYVAPIKAAGADYIPSYRRLQKGETLEEYPFEDDPSDALMVLDQDWPFDGAVVEIPFAPGKMAPVTGIYSGLLYRMLDEAMSERLAKQETAEAGISKKPKD